MAVGGNGGPAVIAREIVLAHGGTIAVQSTAETGTTFTVRLPRARAAREAGERERPSAPPVAADQHPLA